MPGIYILDYDDDINYILCNWFQSHGYEVKGFSNHEELFKQLTISHPDCIILDTFYGRLTSTVNICHSIRYLLQYTGNIIVTSTSNLSASDIELCNASRFFAKPFDLSEVVMEVNRLLISARGKNSMKQTYPMYINV